MGDVLVYWRDFNRRRVEDGELTLRWHSSSRFIERLGRGDKIWLVTSGRQLRQEPQQAAFLVAVWTVDAVVPNPGDEAAYPPERYRFRAAAREDESLVLATPVPVDHVLRPAGADRAMSIGRYLQGPRRLDDGKVRLLKAAAAGELATAWLGRRR